MIPTRPVISNARRAEQALVIGAAGSDASALPADEPTTLHSAHGATTRVEPKCTNQASTKGKTLMTMKSFSMARESIREADALDDAQPASSRTPWKAPSRRLAVPEQRAAYEFVAFMATSAMLSAMRRGDGHPVMVLPPFLADDANTVPLRWVLDSHGYAVYGWGQGPNLSRTRNIVEGLPRWLTRLHERHGVKVSLVGHSGGGNWARDLARQVPSAVRQVITLGSPFRLRPGDATRADRIATQLLRDQVPPDAEALIDEEQREPLPVPVTAIYTRTDGVAPWQAGIESEGPHRENIEVVGSHCGLGYNPAAVIAVIDRLAQPEGRWRPFRPPPFTRRLFPTPVYWRSTPVRRAG
jgi:pimeloyl-ACP methyl ester carboxylesterase